MQDSGSGVCRVLGQLDKLTEEEWLTLRRRGIGASEIAGVMRMSPWQSPLSIYTDKAENISDYEETLAMELGKALEGFLKDKFVKWLKKMEVNDVTFLPPAIYQSIGWPFLLATPDGIFNHPEGARGVELKTASEYKRAEWADDEVPDAYYLQCQQCMAVTGIDVWYLAYLIGNRKFDVVKIPRNEGVIERIVEAGAEFWHEHVEKRIPPAPGGLGIDTQVLRTLYPEGEGVIDLPHLEDKYEQIKKLQAEAKASAELADTLKREIMAVMKDAETAIFGTREDGKPKRATWRLVKGGPVSFVRKDSRQFRIY